MQPASTPLIEAGTSAYRRVCLALLIASLVIFANLYAIHPLLPLIAEHYQVSVLKAANAFNLTSLTLGLALLVIGPLSDAWGRRNILLCGLLATALLTLAMAWTSHYHSLLVLRALLGVALAVLPATAVAYLGDTVSRNALIGAVGLYISGNTLGGAGGRLVGGVLADHFGLHMMFLLVGGVSLGGVLLIAWLLPPPGNFQRQTLAPRNVFANFGRHLRHPLLWPAMLLGGLNFLIFVNLYTYLTFRLSAPPWQLGASALGLLFLSYLGGTFSAALSSRMAARSQTGGMALGVGILLLGCLLTLANNLGLIVLGLVINSFGFFLTHSLANAWVNQHAEQAKASATSLYSVCYYLGAAVGIYYLQSFWQWAGWPAVIGAAALVLLVNLALIALLQWRSASYNADNSDPEAMPS
ncbi:MFS transporter [Halopseudomonas salegens]|uniref:MFS transporter, YNFM family, putative membrane transport protein n=1 Tax=Halopseudomonas salegens TaxID=1434072 RepID=A0A1H2HFQ3_9GAMM|nr:MFS transporter [Halopseudomonas salegens]SDU30626.1 MFS transporter, YNFM family, putative membrane transport protein [Halopseudomonas salegens]